MYGKRKGKAHYIIYSNVLRTNYCRIKFRTDLIRNKNYQRG